MQLFQNYKLCPALSSWSKGAGNNNFYQLKKLVPPHKCWTFLLFSVVKKTKHYRGKKSEKTLIKKVKLNHRFQDESVHIDAYRND